MSNLSIVLLTTACSIAASADACLIAPTPDEAAASGMSSAMVENGGGVQSQIRPVGPDADALISVARDVSPEWAKTLETARSKDPETFRVAAAKLGKRLSSLAVLREHKPALYALRVEELKVQGQLEGLGSQWMSARLGSRAAESEKLESQIRGLAGTLVDLNLRSRAMELAEIDAVMRTMRADLERDARARDETVEKMVSASRDGTGENVLGGRAPVDAPALPTKSAVPASVPTSTKPQAP